MIYFAIIETDNGLSIVEYSPGQDAVAIAEAQGGVLVDAGPFTSFDQAYDTLLDLQADDQDRELA